jgi:hypothetical protein
MTSTIKSKTQTILATGVLNLQSIFIVLGLIVSLTNCNNSKPIPAKEKVKPRVIVTCDPECDDSNSMVRFLLYSTDFNVEGLVYASSQFHWAGDGKGTKFSHPNREYNSRGMNMGPFESYRWAKGERFIDNAVEAYEKAYPNLKVHDPDYPTPEYLKSKIRYGNIEFEGDISKDTPGSDLIKSLILDSVPGTLFVTAWGGQSTIARALKSIQEQYENTPDWNKIKAKISKKVMILPSGEQDDTYKDYTKPNWPDIGYASIGGTAIGLGYGSQNRTAAADEVYYTPEWTMQNISTKGPLGAFYRVWGDGKQMVQDDIFDYFGFADYTDEQLRKMGYFVWTPVQKKGSFLGEGDTFTYLNLMDNGLRAWEDDTYGGMSGRKREKVSLDYTQPIDTAVIARMFRRDPVFPNFFPVLQNDFAARFAWCVTPNYKDANHNPAVDAPLSISAKPGEKVKLEGSVTDPDGNAVTSKWWLFKVGTYSGDVKIDDPSSQRTSITIPEDAKPGQTIHMILEASDNGSPALTRYHRTIITVI